MALWAMFGTEVWSHARIFVLSPQVLQPTHIQLGPHKV